MARTFDPQHIHYSLCDRSSQLTLSDKTDKIILQCQFLYVVASFLFCTYFFYKHIQMCNMGTIFSTYFENIQYQIPEFHMI